MYDKTSPARPAGSNFELPPRYFVGHGQHPTTLGRPYLDDGSNFVAWLTEGDDVAALAWEHYHGAETRRAEYLAAMSRHADEYRAAATKADAARFEADDVADYVGDVAPARVGSLYALAAVEATRAGLAAGRGGYDGLRAAWLAEGERLADVARGWDEIADARDFGTCDQCGKTASPLQFGPTCARCVTADDVTGDALASAWA